MLVLSGRGASSVEVSFKSPVTIMPMRLQDNGANGWSWTGCGGIRGFYLQPLSGNAMAGAGAVDFAALEYGSAADVLPGPSLPRTPVGLGTRLLDGSGGNQGPTFETTVTLRPGRYRAHLLGEGACTVRVPMEGLRSSVRKATSQRTRLQFDVAALGPTGSGASPALPVPHAGVATFPMTVRSTTLAFSLLHRLNYAQAGGPTGVSAYELCIEPDAAPPCGQFNGTTLPGRTVPERSGFYHQSMTISSGGPVGPGGGPLPVPLPHLIHASTTNLATWYAPGWLVPGTYTAKVVLGSTLSTTTQAAMFALDLG